MRKLKTLSAKFALKKLKASVDTRELIFMFYVSRIMFHLLSIMQYEMGIGILIYGGTIQWKQQKFWKRLKLIEYLS